MKCTRYGLVSYDRVTNNTCCVLKINMRLMGVEQGMRKVVGLIIERMEWVGEMVNMVRERERERERKRGKRRAC